MHLTMPLNVKPLDCMTSERSCRHLSRQGGRLVDIVYDDNDTESVSRRAIDSDNVTLRQMPLCIESRVALRGS